MTRDELIGRAADILRYHDCKQARDAARLVISLALGDAALIAREYAKENWGFTELEAAVEEIEQRILALVPDVVYFDRD